MRKQRRVGRLLREREVRLRLAVDAVRGGLGGGLAVGVVGTKIVVVGHLRERHGGKDGALRRLRKDQIVLIAEQRDVVGRNVAVVQIARLHQEERTSLRQMRVDRMVGTAVGAGSGGKREIGGAPRGGAV
jgi:hypothetical protein